MSKPLPINLGADVTDQCPCQPGVYLHYAGAGRQATDDPSGGTFSLVARYHLPGWNFSRPWPANNVSPSGGASPSVATWLRPEAEVSAPRPTLNTPGSPSIVNSTSQTQICAQSLFQLGEATCGSFMSAWRH